MVNNESSNRLRVSAPRSSAGYPVCCSRHGSQWAIPNGCVCTVTASRSGAPRSFPTAALHQTTCGAAPQPPPYCPSSNNTWALFFGAHSRWQRPTGTVRFPHGALHTPAFDAVDSLAQGRAHGTRAGATVGFESSARARAAGSLAVRLHGRGAPRRSASHTRLVTFLFAGGTAVWPPSLPIRLPLHSRPCGPPSNRPPPVVRFFFSLPAPFRLSDRSGGRSIRLSRPSPSPPPLPDSALPD